jgi:hypothetical protein
MGGTSAAQGQRHGDGQEQSAARPFGSLVRALARSRKRIENWAGHETARKNRE